MRGLAARAGHVGAPLSALRRVLVVVGFVFLVIAPLGLLFTFMAAFFPGPEAHNGPGTLAFLFVFMCLGPLAVGLAAVGIGDRALFLRLLAAPPTYARSAWRVVLEPRLWGRRFLSTSVGRALLGLLIVAVGGVTAAGPHQGLRVAIAWFVLTAYSALDPIVVALRRGAWLAGIAFSVVGWIPLFVIGAATADGMGPDGMIFLLPMMVYPGAIGVSGIVRLIGLTRSRSERAAAVDPAQ
ncbi:MAG TPA: hypothetical protein VGQ33_18400 [Vicinamibacteria bacterium]|nr:hypothetical protein [Vicinamibacteria bacterium]